VAHEVVNTFAFEERLSPISKRFFVLITSQHVGSPPEVSTLLIAVQDYGLQVIART
jgi:hypothetical protein